jgi:SAM-dependent methyltransferase
MPGRRAAQAAIRRGWLVRQSVTMAVGPDLSAVERRMREDWNARAREDAHYYVAFGRREQDPEEFFATATDVVRSLRREWRRLPAARPRQRRALEIGCGPGRLMRPLAADFGEIHGVDVADEMIARARANLAGVAHAHPHVGAGADLRQFADDSFDFVYSYAVFQHIPDAQVTWSYLREAARVLKPGGILRCQLNGLRKRPGEVATTWSGASFTGAELRAFARGHGLQSLALEGELTQYLWLTCRKGAPGRLESLRADAGTARMTAAIRRVTNATSSEPVAPVRGRYAALSLLVERLPEHADLDELQVRVQQTAAQTTYIGPPEQDGLAQVNCLLPEHLHTGIAPVELSWGGVPLAAPATVRLLPPAPSAPRVVSLTDGVNLLAERRVESGTVKVTLEEPGEMAEFAVTVNGRAAREVETFLVIPQVPRWEVNFTLPEGIGPGAARVEMRIGRRALAPVEVTVEAR